MKQIVIERLLSHVDDDVIRRGAHLDFNFPYSMERR